MRITVEKIKNGVILTWSKATEGVATASNQIESMIEKFTDAAIKIGQAKAGKVTKKKSEEPKPSLAPMPTSRYVPENDVEGLAGWIVKARHDETECSKLSQLDRSFRHQGMGYAVNGVTVVVEFLAQGFVLRAGGEATFYNDEAELAKAIFAFVPPKPPTWDPRFGMPGLPTGLAAPGAFDHEAPALLARNVHPGEECPPDGSCLEGAAGVNLSPK